MTILHALNARYDRLASLELAPIPGFAPSQISFTILLDRDGKCVAVQDERTGDGAKRRPQIRLAPAAPKRTVGIASGAFWDKTSYVLGRSAADTTVSAAKQAKDAERLIKEHAAFRARHEALLDGVDDAGCAALLAFLRNWTPEQYDALAHADAMLDQNVAFRLQGEPTFIHDRPAARAALRAEANARDAGPQAMCLVTGTLAPIARLHPSIKGVAGAQSSGAALVSFNLDAFTSFGKTQGGNAPVSEAAAFAYGTALNALLASSGTTAKGRPIYRNRVMLGETTVAFWAEHGDAEAITRATLRGEEEEYVDLESGPTVNDVTETDKLRTTLTRMQDGMPLADADPQMDAASKVYVLGLSPNAARLSVRFWVEQSLADFAENFRLHWQDLRLDPPPHPWPPPLWRLLLELAPQRKSENIPPHLSGAVMRAILTGQPYPRALLTQTIVRIRADGDINSLRVAIAKAVITRPARKKHDATASQSVDVPPWKDTLMAFDRNEPNVGYRLGRLFALLDYAQFLSVGLVNAGLKEKFFASASATPRRIFPSILRMSQNHLSDARKQPEKRGRAIHTESEIKQVMDGLDAHTPFPTTLTLDDQGRFIVGFYHQRPPQGYGAAPSAKSSETDEEI